MKVTSERSASAWKPARLGATGTPLSRTVPAGRERAALYSSLTNESYAVLRDPVTRALHLLETHGVWLGVRLWTNHAGRDGVVYRQDQRRVRRDAAH